MAQLSSAAGFIILGFEEISHLPTEQQAEKIANAFSEVNQEYDELKDEHIKIPHSALKIFLLSV